MSKRTISTKILVSKKIKVGSSSSIAMVKREEPDPKLENQLTNGDDDVPNNLKEQFVALFSEPQYLHGISGSSLKERFGENYTKLVPIINELTAESRLNMAQVGGDSELFYTLVSSDVASKFLGLDAQARLVYQVIEKAGNMGIWTKEIRIATNIQQQALNKIFKILEQRRLIKPVKSVTAKAKKLYMLYDLQPSTELTGGVWYSDLEFDHEFISELRGFLIHMTRRMNQGRGVTIMELRNVMVENKVSRVELSLEDLRQLVQTLVYDYILDVVENDEGENLYVAARRVSTMCEFKWWDCLDPDFHFRTIRFEDGVTLGPHEPHYHTA